MAQFDVLRALMVVVGADPSGAPVVKASKAKTAAEVAALCWQPAPPGVRPVPVPPSTVRVSLCKARRKGLVAAVREPCGRAGPSGWPSAWRYRYTLTARGLRSYVRQVAGFPTAAVQQAADVARAAGRAEGFAAGVAAGRAEGYGAGYCDAIAKVPARFPVPQFLPVP